jgi:beta-lactamase class A
LPSGTAVARLPRHDAALAARLARAAASFRGHAGVWVHDLRTGRAAGVNEDALVPAASTVKLAPLLAGLRAGDAYAYDVRQLGAWSSNLAANRIAARLGLAAIARALRDLGMTRSTYPGLYRAGTARGPGGHVRVTTPRDLGRALLRLHAAALGHRWALRETRLTRRLAAAALATLRGSRPVGENRGLLRPALPPGTPLAEKNGWISDARLTAAIVYARRGPAIVVVAAFGEAGVSEAEGIALGRRVLAAAGLR